MAYILRGRGVGRAAGPYYCFVCDCARHSRTRGTRVAGVVVQVLVRSTAILTPFSIACRYPMLRDRQTTRYAIHIRPLAVRWPRDGRSTARRAYLARSSISSPPLRAFAPQRLILPHP